MKLRRSSALKQEVEAWLREDIISEQQYQVLLKRYELDIEAAWYTQTNFIIQSVAFLMAAMGVGLLIGFNWDILPVPIRMLTGLLPLFASYIAGFYFFSRSEQDKSELAFVFASLLFGCNIALQAQIFHISSYYPDGILWWILGALPVMFFFKSTFLNCFLQLLTMMWLHLQSEYHQFAWLGIIILGAILYQNYLKPNSWAAIILFFTIGYFVLNICIAMRESRNWGIEAEILLPSFACGYVMAYVGLVRFFESSYSERFTQRITAIGHTAIVFYLFFYTFTDATSSLTYIKASNIFVILGLILWVLGAVFSVLKQAKNYENYIVLGIALTCILPPVLGLSDESAFIFVVFCNLLFLAYAVWSIYSGIQNRNKGGFMYGIFLLVALAFARYISLMADFLTAGILFILFAILLLVINKQWNKRYAK